MVKTARFLLLFVIVGLYCIPSYGRGDRMLTPEERRESDRKEYVRDKLYEDYGVRKKEESILDQLDTNGDDPIENWGSNYSDRPSISLVTGYEDWTVMLRQTDETIREIDHTFKWIGTEFDIPLMKSFRLNINTSIAKTIMQGEFDHFRLGAAPTFRLGVNTFYDCGVADAGFQYEYLYGPNFEREANGQFNDYMFKLNRFTFESGITTNEHVRPFAAVRVTKYDGEFQPSSGPTIMLDRYDSPVGGSVGIDLRTGPWESRMEMRFGDVEHGGLFKLKYQFKFD